MTTTNETPTTPLPDYKTIRVTDPVRGGVWLQLWKRTDERMMCSIFWNSSNGSYELERHVAVAPEVEEWFRKEAERTLPGDAG